MLRNSIQHWLAISLLFALTFAASSGCNSATDTESSSNVAENKPVVRLSIEERLAQPVSEKRNEISKESLQISAGDNGLYTLLIPTDYEERKPLPLILYLHDGGGARGRSFPHYGATALQGLVEPALGELGAILVAPDSGPARWDADRNQDFIATLIEHLQKEFEIDTDRTLICGYSMGGHGAWFFAEAHEDFFRTAIPIAGGPVTDKTDWTNQFYVIHSKDDNVVPFADTESYVKKLQESGVKVQTDYLTGYDHFQIPRYAQPLKKAVPWVKEAWLDAASSEEK